MSLVSLLPIGVAVAQVVIRVVGEAEFANGIGDLKGVGALLRGRKGDDPDIRKIGKSISAELESSLTADSVGARHKQDLEAVANHVELMVLKLSRNDEAILALARAPQDARQYLYGHGGDKVLRDAPLHAEGVARKLLDATADILAKYSPRSEKFTQLALVELLRSVEELNDVPQDLKQALKNTNEILSRLPPEPAAEEPISKQEILQSIHARRKIVRGLIDSTQGALIPREGLLERAFDGLHYPLAYLGAGGLGKSVLVGEIADNSSKRERILVACAAIDGTNQLRDAAHIDELLGEQATGLHLSLSNALAACTNRPLLVIDTVDILLREETAASICELLARWSEQADLVVTCRSREWHDLVAAWLHNFTLVEMPSLSKEEILEWSRKFVEHDQIPDEFAHRFLQSIIAAAEAELGRNLLGVPLRLAMATRLYAARGALPPGLTVTQLYKSYWDERVSTGRDRRKNTRSVRAIEKTARGVAREVWRQSVDQFSEDVHFDGDHDACNALLSEGILHQLGNRFQFFHQTFAEFAVARCLGDVGDDGDLNRLQEGLLSQRSGYWGIASYLVFEELSSQRYERVIDSIPITSIEGVRIVLESLLTRNEFELVQRRMNQLIDESPNHVAAASDLFDATPEAYREVVANGLLVLAATGSGSGDFTAVVRALSLLITQMPGPEGVEPLAAVLNIINLREHSRDPLAAAESRRLIEAVFTDTAPNETFLLEVSISHYTGQPAPGQYGIIKATLQSGDARLQSELIRQAQRRKVPPGAVDLLAELLRAEFDAPERRDSRIWETWKDVLSDTLPKRWDAVQVRLIAHMARNEAVRDELLAEAFAPKIGVRRDLLINSLRFVAVSDPDTFATMLAHSRLPQEPAAAHAYARLTDELGSDLAPKLRDRILHSLQQISHLNSRSVWPAIARLSSMDLRSVDAMLEQLRGAVEGTGTPAPREWRRVVESVTTVLGNNLTPSALATRHDQLRVLWDLASPIDSIAICRILARVSAFSTSARKEFDEFVDSNREGAQLKGVQALVASRGEWPEDIWSASLPWVVALMRVQRDGAAIALARTLEIDVSDPHWTVVETKTIVGRLIESLEQHHDPQVSQSLIRLLTAAAHDGTDVARPTAKQVDCAIEEMRKRLTRQAIAADLSYAKALYAQYVAMITGIAMRLYDVEKVIDMVETLALEVDTAVFGSTARKSLVLALSSVQRRKPLWWSRLESLWPRLFEQNRGAVADLALSGLVPEWKVVAERLARREDCPTDVAVEIHRRLGGHRR